MMGTFKNIKKTISAHIPGSTLNIAAAKRKLEKELRAAGYSRSHAVAEASRRFKECKHA